MQGVGQLKFRGFYIVHVEKCLQMLGAYGGDDSMVWMYNVADFLYVPHMAGPHLTDKDFMGRF